MRPWRGWLRRIEQGEGRNAWHDGREASGQNWRRPPVCRGRSSGWPHGGWAAKFSPSMGVDYVRELCRFQGREREESSPIRGRWRRNNVQCTLRGVHDNFRHRTVICITSKALVRVCYSRNDPVHLPTFGIVAGKPRMPVAQYAPGRTPPPAVRIDGMAKGDRKCDPTILSQEGSVVRVWGG